MSIRFVATMAAVCSLSSAVQAAPAPRDLKDFSQPYPYHLNKIWNLEEKDIRSGAPSARLAPRTAPLVVDLAKGTVPGACDSGKAWTGQATYLNSDIGTIQYWGMGRGCHPTGIGTIQYADGSTYFGFVETYLYKDHGENADIPLQRDRARVAVRHGPGQFTDGRTGKVQVGQWSDDKFVEDLAADPAFMKRHREALASIADRGAPQFTAAIFDWSNFMSAAHLDAILDGAPLATAPVTSPPSNSGGPEAELLRAAALRGEAMAASARDRTRVPDLMLKTWPELAVLAPVLARYGNAPWQSAPVLQAKLFGGFKCPAEDKADVSWTHPEMALTYRGEHKDCYPKGFGHIVETSDGNGTEWIGQVTMVRQSDGEKRLRPVPNGVGELRLSDGTRVFARASYTRPAEGETGTFGGVLSGRRAMLALGLVRADGSVFFYQQPPKDDAYTHDERADLLKYLWENLPLQLKDMVWHHPNGAVIRTSFIASGADKGAFSKYTPTGKTVFEIPELGLSATADAMYGWNGYRLPKLKLAQSLYGLPPGRYFPEPVVFSGFPIEDSVGWLHRRLVPADDATLKSMPRLDDAAAACSDDRMRRLAPPMWRVWRRTCDAPQVQLFHPTGWLTLLVELDATGRPKTQTLVQHNGLNAAQQSWTRYTAERFTFRPDSMFGDWPLPQGTVEIVNRYSSAGPAGESGYTYRGPTGGETGRSPHGVGECALLETQDWMPCEMNDGKRIDPAYQAQAKRFNERREAFRREVAERDRLQAEREAQSAAEQARWAAAQQERQRQLDAENAEIDRHNDALVAQQWTRMQSEGEARNAKLKQDLADIDRRAQDARAAGDAVARQRAEQDRLNREEAERQARDRAAGERAYAEAQASAAQNKAQAEAAYQQQRQIDQARAQAAANDAARRAAGAYGAAPSAPSSGSSSGYAGSSPAASGGGALPKPDTAKIDRCAKLSRDIMSAGSDFHCNMNGKGFPTISAQRDAESKCYAEVAAKVAPLKAQYQDECSSSPTDGGVTRY